MIKRYLNLPVLLIVFTTLSLVIIWFKDGYLLGSAESALPFYDLNRYFNIQEIAEQLGDDDDDDIDTKDAKDIMNTIKKSDSSNTNKLAKTAAIMQQGDTDKIIQPKSSDVKNIERKLKAGR